MGQQGRERYLEHFTADRMARRTLEVYRRVLEEG
jgi:glycosyltransferase involved in cell wall biosynthesis